VIARSCTQWLRDLQDTVPTVVLGAKDERGVDLTDVKVTFDGEPLATVLDGKPIELDAGEHVLRFERDASLPAEEKLVLRAGEKARVVTVVLPSIQAPASSASIEAPPKPVPREPSLARNVTLGAMGVGALAALGVGVAFFVEANQAKADAANIRQSLPTSSACSGVAALAMCPALNDKVNAQFSDLNMSTGFFIGAGGLAAAAMVTWLAWPRSSPPPATGWIAPARGGAVVGLGGSFE
jgi:hypothetical protein